MINPPTSKECLQHAWSALLRGDMDERDRLCERAKSLIKAEQYGDAVSSILAVDFYVDSADIVIETKRMAKAVGAING